MILGGATVGGIDLNFSEEYWLDITVGAEHMPDRLRFTSVGYAYRARIADSATVAVSAPTGGGWTDNGTVVRLASGTDSVGIGTGDPAEKLHVNGDIRLNLGSAVAFGGDDTRVYGSSGDLRITADDDIYLQPDDDVYIRADGGSDWIQFDPGGQKVGIGTEDPTPTLTVKGHVGIQQADTPKFHIGYYNQGLSVTETGEADYRLYIKEGGDVGIGTSDPDAKLGVAGEQNVTGAYQGNKSSSSGPDGAPFPRPAYNSGWRAISQDQALPLTHSIGGDPDNYVVDLQFFDTASAGRNQAHYGGLESDSGNRYGAYWKELTNSQITVYRHLNDTTVDSVRVRIWVYK